MRARRSVPPSGGLRSSSSPSSAPTRSQRPRSPVPPPPPRSAPPTPSSETSTVSSPLCVAMSHARRVGVRVLDRVGQRLGDEEVDAGLDRRREPPFVGPVRDGHLEREPRDERLDGREQPVIREHAGMDPGRQPAQLGHAVVGELDPVLAERPRALRVLVRHPLREPEVHHRAHELLLGAVVEVALELGAGRVRGLDHPPPGDLQLLGARLRDVALARHLLRPPPRLDVAEGGHRAAALAHRERAHRDRHGHDRAVLADEEVVELVERLTGVARLGELALRLRVRRPVGVLVVDRLVGGPTEQLGRVGVAERRDPGVVEVVEAPRRIEHPDRLVDLREDRLALAQRLLGLVLLHQALEGDDHALAPGEIDRRRGVGDGQHRPVAAHEPVAVPHRPPGPARLAHRALRERVGRAVAALVVDRLVAGPATELVELVVAERREPRRVDERDEPVMVDDPHRERHAVEDRVQLLHGAEYHGRLPPGANLVNAPREFAARPRPLSGAGRRRRRRRWSRCRGCRRR